MGTAGALLLPKAAIPTCQAAGEGGTAPCSALLWPTSVSAWVSKPRGGGKSQACPANCNTREQTLLVMAI